MRRWYWVGGGIALAILAASYSVGRWASREHDDSFDYELAALVLTGLGTTALAAATGVLALVTWKLASDERSRRPVLSLSADEVPPIYSRVESDRCPYIRMRVGNLAGLRPAAGARVLVDRYWPTGHPDQVDSLGTAPLGWTSSGHEGALGAVTVFAGTNRVFDLGSLMRPDPTNPA